MKQRLSGDINACCYNLKPSDFLLVFTNPSDVPSGTWKEVQIRREQYHIDENAVFAPGRVLTEVAYRLLHRPPTFNLSYIHEGRPFGNVTLTAKGMFGTRQYGLCEINMPSIDEIIEPLVKAEFIRNKTLDRMHIIKAIREVLEGRSDDPDKDLAHLVQ